MKKAIDITGLEFNKLKVLEIAHSDRRDRYWKCECECGNITYVTGPDLRRGHKKSCGKCEESIEKSKLSPYKSIYGNYKRNAAKRNLEFNLTFEQFMEICKKDCYYCGTQPAQIYSKKGLKHEAIYNGIDRHDNSKGYNYNNVVASCRFCNFAKYQSTPEEFYEWIDRLVKKRSKSGTL